MPVYDNISYNLGNDSEQKKEAKKVKKRAKKEAKKIAKQVLVCAGRVWEKTTFIINYFFFSHADPKEKKKKSL